MNRKFTRRLLSLVIAFFMVVSLLPTSLFSVAVQAATGETHYLAFASDRHSSTTAISSSMGKFPSSVEYVCLNGDMVNNTESYNTSTVQNEVTKLFSNAAVDIVYGTHDASATDDAGIMNGTTAGSSGLMYTGTNSDGTTAYYVYGIAYNDMSSSSSASTAAAAFSNWVKKVDTSIPVFIACHMPLHQRRGDNNGAATWMTAINSAAETRDIVYFWGHNHTGETSADTKVYLVNKGGTLTPQGGSATTINFTYMNAGYLNQKTSATLVTITDSTITLDKYVNGSQDSSVSTTITRTSSSGSATEKTISSISVNAASAKTEFTKGDTFSSTGLVVTATYSDGTTGLVTDYTTSDYDMSTTGTQTVTVTAGEKTATYSITVSEPASEDGSVTITTEGTPTTVTTYNYASSVTSGNEYVLVSNGYALVNNNGTLSAVAVTVNNDGTITLGSDTTESTVLWTITKNSDYTTYGADTIVNNGSYLARTSGTGSYVATVLTSASSKTAWSYAYDQLAQIGGSSNTTTYYAYYDADNSAFYTGTIAGTLQLYQKTETETSTSTSVKYTVAGNNINATVADSDTAILSASISADNGSDTSTLGGTYSYEEASDPSNIISSIEGDKITFTGIGGTATVKVSYTWTSGSNTYTAFNDLTVTTTAKEESSTEKTLSSISVDASKATTTYTAGDTFSTDGLVVTAAYSDDSTETVTDYTVSDVDMTTAGTKTVTVTYGEKTAAYEITVNAAAEKESETAYVDGTTTTITQKTVYALTSSITSGKKYLIVNKNSAGSGYALKNSSGSVDAESVTVKAADSTVSVPYIETDNSNIVWTAGGSSSYTFKNGSYYIAEDYSYSSWSYELDLSTSSESWTWSSNKNRLSIKPYYYLSYNSGWSISTSASSVYLYEEKAVDVETTTTVKGTYALDATDISKTVVADSTSSIDKKITFTADGSTTATDVTSTLGGTYAYTVSSDANSIIKNIADGTITFTGAAGEAKVKVAYTFIAADNKSYTIWDTITVTAKAPDFTIDITDGTDSITDTVSVKSVTSTTTKQFAYSLTYTEGETIVPVTPTTGISWSSSDETIATVDSTGKVSFTGNEGTVNITVSYAVGEGTSVTDTITISATTSSYIVPADGTADFPEYPTQGAIRYDKTASAVGSFNETGVAQVELSMTGVPYVTNNAVDVVMMLDMTGSMTTARISALKAAAKTFLESIVKNEDGTYNSNRIAIYYFNKSGVTNVYGTLATVSSYTALSTIESAIDSMTTTSGGTPYDTALAKCQSVLSAAKTDGTGNDRAQYCVFMSDGCPTSILWDYGDGTTTTGDYDNGDDLSSVKNNTEYYSEHMKADGVNMYTVGLGIDDDDDGYQSILKHIASDPEDEHSFFVADADAAAGMSDVFADIAASIKQAATDITVVDKIADDYSLILNAPSGVTLPTGTELAVQVVRYTLDSNHERNSSEVIETVTASDTSKVTTDASGNVTYIDGDNFVYDAATRTITWTADTLNTYELALSYYLYLDNSAGVAAADQVAAGTYPTNDYATLTYTNFNGNECQQYFPVPQMTWNGAQVSYVFYLVNSDGKPVNKSGQVVDFANASFVTDIYTKAVTWNTDEAETLSADLLASELLPSGYTLFDTDAEYKINVYEDESGTDLGNNFTIAGGETAGSTSSTTKVYNTKAGTKISAYGTYTKSNCTLDFANTTVAFAVTWSAKLNPDTVVIDYGLPVDIDVTTNDLFDNQVNGIGSGCSAYGDIAQDTGLSTTSKLGNKSISLNYGDANINGLYVRYTPTTMSMTDADVFYYETAVSYYEGSTKHEGYMYSKVTVVPATTIYYEDSFVKYTNGTSSDGTGTWSSAGSNDDKATQDADRPGVSQISASIDADNLYGYDSAYTNDTTYSNGGAHKVTVSSSNTSNPTASFTFTGTGFDLISLTSNTTGTIMVDITNSDGSYTNNWIVDTYYGYTYTKGSGYTVYTWTFGNDEKWHLTSTDTTESIPSESETTKPDNPSVGDTFKSFTETGTWTATTDTENSLYQIPVIKSPVLDYGTYTVTITPAYAKFFDHTSDGSYDFYLDAVRVYNSALESDTALDAYTQDGEAYPEYLELRTQILSQETFGAATDKTPGAVFIDGYGTSGTVANYSSYGPNNEVYLSKGQSVAFTLENSNYAKIAKTAIGLKAPNGSGTLTLNALDNDGNVVNTQEISASSATELYYDISSFAKYTDGETPIIVLTNNTDNLISITNIRTTYKEDPETTVSTTSTVSNAKALLATSFLTASYQSEVASDPVAVEPETFEPESMTVKINKTSAKVGDKITITVNASSDVAEVIVNGTVATKGSTSSKTGLTKWTYSTKAAEVGTSSFEVIAKNASGIASESVTTEVTVSAATTFSKLKNWLSSLWG